MRIDFTVNGRPQEADDVWEGESLLYVLRERLGLPGSKNACEQGECGSCTVRLDGVPVCSCLVAAGQVQGREVVTVEGLADLARRRSGGTSPDAAGGTGPGTGEGGGLAPVQQAFLDAGAVQCGFCTPGLLVAVDELLERDPDPTDADIREALSGNLCRCTGYEKIMDAVRLAAARQSEGV
ncbi:(2Fe-2S)-binding protein [Streptomyces sp. NRRL S-37]|uniref:(2Fe-2S)-binding protein n=1 Tax=Streptomyces sp. NRRL S-37 TaxID=1463903 RepID=UPI0004CAF535|nr:(2Fe-2S)-binding protein [Streptomyces sp. NRRL S-37]